MNDDQTPLSTVHRLGCASSDRSVGPWVEHGPGVWRRHGPVGFFSLFGSDIVAMASIVPGHVPSGSFSCYSCDGMGDVSGHMWGDISSVDVPGALDAMKRMVDDDLRRWGWVVDGVGPRVSWWGRLRLAWQGTKRVIGGWTSTT